MVRQTSHSSALLRRVGRLPNQPGVYCLKDVKRTILYVGKAISLRKRVSSYFRPARMQSARIAQMMRKIVAVEIHQTSSEAEALVLEAQLIKQYRPRYNVAFRDDKTYPLLKVSNESFPRLLIVRRKQVPEQKETRRGRSGGAVFFGPYTDAGLMHEAVRFMRRVFPLRTCRVFPKAPCLEYHLGQCLAPCAGFIDTKNYLRIVDDLIAFLEGRRDELLRDLSRRMAQASRDERFEDAARVRDQIQALTSVIVAKAKSLSAGALEQLQAVLKLSHLPKRIEAFDISNIFGADAVGSMVVFTDGQPNKSHYRHFRIETVKGIDDYKMMREVICRRYSKTLARQLPFPDLILVDGGKGQLSAACEELKSLRLTVPVMGLAKRFEHIFLPKAQEPIVLLAASPVLQLVQRIRDEAHRFAVTYHRKLRGRSISMSVLHEIPGIGPQKTKRLIAHFGSVKEIRKASASDVAQVAGISSTRAEKLLHHVGGAITRTIHVRRSRKL